METSLANMHYISSKRNKSLTFNRLLTFIWEQESALRRSYDPKSSLYPPKQKEELGPLKVLLANPT